MPRKLEVEIVGDARSLERAFGRAGHAGDGFGRSLASLGKVAAVAGAAIAAGVGVGLAVAAKKAIDFEREMRNVNSIARLSEDQFKEVSNSVLNMARDVGQK